MKTKRRQASEASLAFLDVISCGFGAIVLLLVIARIGDPASIENIKDQLIGSLKAFQLELFDIRGETILLEEQLVSQQEQLSELRERIARLQKQLASAKAQATENAQSLAQEKEQLKLVQQVLSEEMLRLQEAGSVSQNDLVGGIPADSEYIIFVIDTSPSMRGTAWEKVQKEMINILDIYPEVKGLQVLNGYGYYMFDAYQGQWLKDNPDQRDQILRTLQQWAPSDPSNPVGGIEGALRDFYERDRKISIYILGDDFQGRSVKRVVDMVNQINQIDRTISGLARIHAIGFPVQLVAGREPGAGAIKFAALMRELSYNNGGTFVGLNSLN
ncbi:MAG: hypothetical protein CBC09_08330 [Cellvibrionales bacterium TMED49]|nr:hypothetical protein [Porticoccaceae bacterium]OUU36335.1 MAG: hypothetical protein CBC09_08330 [Cellvibrionales bacterium TMED49]